MDYHLHPPFLIVSEASSFPEAWEAFCCKLLNLENNTNQIRRRTPPDQGIDLIWPDRGIAYQCKSVESGRAGDFDVDSACASVDSAVAARGQVPWDEYVICTNIDPTGAQEARLRRCLSDVQMNGASFWRSLCERHPGAVERNFRRLITVPESRVEDAIQSTFVQHYTDELRRKVEAEGFPVFLYSNRHQTVYRLVVAPTLTVGDLVRTLRSFFGLPESQTYRDLDVSVSLTHSLVLGGRKLPFRETLGDLGISEGTVLTYWTTIVWRDLRQGTEQTEVRTSMWHQFRLPAASEVTRTRDPSRTAILRFEAAIAERFAELDAELV